MNKTILFLAFIFILFPSFPYAAQEQLNNELKIPEYPVSKQSRTAFEKDVNLKNSVFTFLYYNSCNSSKGRNYKGMYAMLSKSYLSKNFPNIKSAVDYEKDMERSDETYHLVYLMVESVKYTQNNKATLKIKFESGNEGVLEIMEKDIFFTIENGLWKYDGSDFQSLKVLKTLE